MIGLGSNRLTVCRRGGMSVTQAGRGGMEWLAGGRVPSWASPYSAQATAYLEANYRSQFSDMLAYGKLHPEIVPYVNANPDCINIWFGYKQDGLVFQLDCQYMCTAELWKEIRANLEFVGKGGVTIVDGAPYFNKEADCYYEGPEQSHPFATSTIEIVIGCDELSPTTNLGTAYCENSATNQTIRVQAGFMDAIRGAYFNFDSTLRYWPTQYGPLSAFSCANGNVYRNRTKLTNSSTTGSSKNHGAGTFIGKRYKTDSTSLRNTKIYAIRIYNRLLTEQEILANQAIDLQRWQTS